MTTKTLYCNMLVMDDTLSRALILTKRRGPSFLIGKDNFPGGHIEPGKTPMDGAIRKTAEEANIDATGAPVILVKHLILEKSELYTYATCVPAEVFDGFKSMTDEILRIEAVKPYLAMLAMDPERAAPDILGIIGEGIVLLGHELNKRSNIVVSLEL